MSCANILAVIEAMADSGASPQAIVAAARKIVQQDEDRRAEVREQARIRKQRQRHRERAEPVQPVETKENTSRVTPRDTKPKSPVGSRLSPEWILPDDWLSEARRIAFNAKAPMNDQEIRNEADKFRDYWIAAPGAKGRKCDWIATWRSWIRTGIERRQRFSNASGRGGAGALPQHGRGSIAAAAARRANERQDRADIPNEFDWGDDLAGEGRRNGDDAILIGRSAIGAGGR